MIFLNPWEYVKIVSEINSNYSLYSGKRIAIHLSHGTDNRAYAYVFYNYGFDNYVFVSRDEMEDA